VARRTPLVTSLAAHYRETISIREERCMLTGDREGHIVVKLAS
jgi:hypothetical protein